MKQEAPPQPLDTLAAAAEQAGAGAASAHGTPSAAGGACSAGRAQPLMASLDSLQPAAQRIVQAAHTGWLESNQVHQLMAEHAALGVPLTEQQPARPKGEAPPLRLVFCCRLPQLRQAQPDAHCSCRSSCTCSAGAK